MMDRDKEFDRIFKYFTTIIAIVALTFAMYSQISNLKLNEYKVRTESFTINELKNDIAILHQEIEKFKNQKNIKDNAPKIGNDEENQKIFSNFNLQLTELNEQVTGLRQAINPIKPEEVLTIARLKDSVELLVSQINKLEKEFENKHENFKSAVIRELDASTRATNWLFVVLVPVVLNLLYSIWKDRKESKASATENKTK